MRTHILIPPAALLSRHTRIAALLRRARVVVCDFDGTLVDSNPIKFRAFEVCFAEFSERRADIQAYCRHHHHVPRGEKFRFVYERILGVPYTAEVDTRLHARFAEATTLQIIEAPEIPGAERFLRTIAHSHLTAVLSSTPHALLSEIVTARGWRDCIHLLQGAPVDKTRWLSQLRDARCLARGELLVFGDTAADADAARSAHGVFIGVGSDAATLPGDEAIRDFTEVLSE